MIKEKSLRFLPNPYGVVEKIEPLIFSTTPPFSVLITDEILGLHCMIWLHY